MVLSEPQREALLARIKSLWKNFQCEACGQSNWTILDRVLNLPQFSKGALIVGGVVVPVVVATCTNCGCMRFVSAISIGFINPETGEVAIGQQAEG